LKLGMMEAIFKVSIQEGKKMDMGFINGMMVLNIKDNGKIIV
jgi:hypothetical protein